MEKYRYKAGSSNGEIKEETVSAESELVLRRELESSGLYVFKIEKLSGLNFNFSFQQKIPLTEFLVFNQELTILIKAGIPILNALQLLEDRLENPYFKKVISQIKNMVASGKSLSESFSHFPQLFSPVYISSLHAGETSGSLVEVLKKFTAYQKDVLTFKKRVQQALIYPSFLLGLVLVIIFIFLTKIVPAFSKMYEDINTKLPPSTQLLVKISSVASFYFWHILIILALSGVSFFYWKKTAAGARMIDLLALKIPFIGRIIEKYSIVQFTKTLQTTLEGGISLLKALDLGCEAVSNRYLASQLQSVTIKVSQGVRLGAALKEVKLIPAIVVEMISVGEETGSLEEMLENISLLFDEEINNNVASFLAVIEPTLILIMGLIVTAILISMYLPIFEMAGRLGG